MIKPKRLLSLLLRFIAFGTTLAAVILMATSHEKGTFFAVSYEAKYTDTPAFKYFVIAYAIVTVYGFLVLFLPPGSPIWRLVLALDLVINENVAVKDAGGKEIESQLLPLLNDSVGIRDYYSKAYLGMASNVTPKFWLAFTASLPPLGFNTYIISSSSSTASRAASTSSQVYDTKVSQNDTVEIGPGNLKLIYSGKGQLTQYINSRSLVCNIYWNFKVFQSHYNVLSLVVSRASLHISAKLLTEMI